MSNKGQMGKWAEAQAQAWLDEKSKAYSIMCWHRYPDARSARGTLSAQPADYLVSILLNNGHNWVSHLEIKETAQKNSLPKAKIGQYGSLLKFHYTGMGTFVVVFRSHHNDWVFFGARDLFDHPICPTSFPFPKQTFATAKDVLNYIYDL